MDTSDIPKKVLTKNTEVPFGDVDARKMAECVLYIKTIHSNVLRILADALKDILQDVNILFTKDYIRIVAKDAHRVSFVYVNLDADRFREGGVFKCETPQVVGVNLATLNTCIQAVAANDILTIYAEPRNISERLGIRIDKYDKNGHVFYTDMWINTIDVADEDNKIPDYQIKTIFSISSMDFQKICREFKAYSNDIKITNDNKGFLKFSASGDCGGRETVMGSTLRKEAVAKSDSQTVSATETLEDTEDEAESQEEDAETLDPEAESESGEESEAESEAESGDEEAELEEEQVSYLFPLKYLNLFTRATNLSTNVKIMVERNTPLIIEYKVATLGQLRFCLAPRIESAEDF